MPDRIAEYRRAVRELIGSGNNRDEKQEYCVPLYRALNEAPKWRDEQGGWKDI